MRYRLRTLLIVLAVGPILLACSRAVHAADNDYGALPLNVEALLLLSPGRDLVTDARLVDSDLNARHRFETACLTALRQLIGSLNHKPAQLIDDRKLTSIVVLSKERSELRAHFAQSSILLRYATEEADKYAALLRDASKDTDELAHVTIFSLGTNTDNLWSCVLPRDHAHSSVTIAIANDRVVLGEVIRQHKSIMAPNSPWLTLLRDERDVAGSAVVIRRVSSASDDGAASTVCVTWIDESGWLRQRWIARDKTAGTEFTAFAEKGADISPERIKELTGGPAGLRTEGKVLDERRIELHYRPIVTTDVGALITTFLVEAGIAGQIGR